MKKKNIIILVIIVIIGLLSLSLLINNREKIKLQNNNINAMYRADNLYFISNDYKVYLNENNDLKEIPELYGTTKIIAGDNGGELALFSDGSVYKYDMDKHTIKKLQLEHKVLDICNSVGNSYVALLDDGSVYLSQDFPNNSENPKKINLEFNIVKIMNVYAADDNSASIIMLDENGKVWMYGGTIGLYQDNFDYNCNNVIELYGVDNVDDMFNLNYSVGVLNTKNNEQFFIGFLLSGDIDEKFSLDEKAVAQCGAVENKSMKILNACGTRYSQVYLTEDNTLTMDHFYIKHFTNTYKNISENIEMYYDDEFGLMLVYPNNKIRVFKDKEPFIDKVRYVKH